MTHTLTDAVLDFQSSGRGLDTLLDRVAVFVYHYPKMRMGWNEDDCGEFFCYFYPKLRRLVERFEYRGRPFEVYLIITLKWQLRTYAGRKATEKLQGRVLGLESFWACDDSGDYAPDSPSAHPDPARQTIDSRGLEIPERARSVLKLGDDNRIRDTATRKRVLYLALKSAAHLTESLIGRIAFLTGYDADWIYRLSEELKARIYSRRSRLLQLSEKRNCCFFRIYCLQEQLRLVAEYALRAELARQLAGEEARLAYLLDEISRVPTDPTHREIAEVLGVPKGSVDSGLYYLKDALRILSN